MHKKAGLLTRPTLARREAPYPMQGRNSEAGPRFTFHTSRFTVPGSDARTKLTDFFSILLAAPRFNRKARCKSGIHAAGDVVDMTVAQIGQRFCCIVAAMATVMTMRMVMVVLFSTNRAVNCPTGITLTSIIRTA